MSARAPLTGHHYTMGPMKHRCGDRSWMGDIWLVLEGNGTHVLIQSVTAQYEHSYGRRPMVVAVAEFDWTPADEMAEAVKSRQALSKTGGSL